VDGDNDGFVDHDGRTEGLDDGTNDGSVDNDGMLEGCDDGGIDGVVDSDGWIEGLDDTEGVNVDGDDDSHVVPKKKVSDSKSSPPFAIRMLL